MSEALGVVGGVLGPFLVLLLLVVPLIVVHELGHMFVARRRGIAVEEFGIGFPPRIAVLHRGARTLLTLNALPFGGFVRMAGATEGSNEPDGWERATLSSKVLVMIAGVVVNLLVAFALMVVLAGPLAERGEVLLADVQPGSPAASGGILPGERISALNGTPFDRFDAPLSGLRQAAGSDVRLTVIGESGSPREVTLRLRTIEEAADKGVLGVSIADVVPAGPLERPVLDVMRLAAERTLDAGGAIVGGLAELVSAPFRSEQDAPALSGPVGIAVGVAGAAERLGLSGLIQIAALLSANLAVLNLLPIPPLDGGRVAALLLRRALGGERGKRVEQALVTAGAIAMLLLFFWITLGDLATVIGGGPR
jgi:regulator of sigma E protease